MRSLFVFGKELLAYDFGEGHPLRPLRLRLLRDLLEAARMLQGPDVEVVGPRAAAAAELALVHEPDYVEAVELLGRGAPIPEPGALRRFGFTSADNPVFPAMHRAAAHVAGGALDAAEALLAGRARRAFHPGGGLHHAMPARASGFCVYNDPACAVARFRREGWRVLYVDGDAHHGDGVEAVFARDPEVLTVSLHEDGRYLFPGTGFPEETGSGAGEGFAVNLPLLPGTSDGSWLEVFERVVPVLARAFRPDVLVTQHGCDAHRLDPLTHLAVSTRAAEAFAQAADALSRELCRGRWLALGGGGYAIWRVVPRAWTLVWAAVSEQEPPATVPARWLQQWRPQAPVALPQRLRDDEEEDAGTAAAATPGERERLARFNRGAADRALELCLPRVRASGDTAP